MTGTKNDLIDRIYCHFHFSSFIVKIQKIFRGKLQRSFWKDMRGPAYLNRSLCVNETDFLSMEEIKDIPINQFFSYNFI